MSNLHPNENEVAKILKLAQKKREDLIVTATSLLKDGARLQKILDLSGSFQDDSFETIKISGDDATRTWHLTIGKESSFGHSIREAIDNFRQ